MSNKEVFDSIYANSAWGYKSGPGSDPFSARTWIDIVNGVIKSNQVSSILEIGCGDWRVGSRYNLNGVLYTGIDASSVIIDELQSFETNDIHFINADAESFQFNHVDLILCKDVFQHLPNASVTTIMDKIMSHSPYVLVCNDWTEVNTGDIEAGGHRRINLKEEPFNYPLIEVCRYGSEDKAIYYSGVK